MNSVFTCGHASALQHHAQDAVDAEPGRCRSLRLRPALVLATEPNHRGPLGEVLDHLRREIAADAGEDLAGHLVRQLDVHRGRQNVAEAQGCRLAEA